VNTVQFVQSGVSAPLRMQTMQVYIQLIWNLPVNLSIEYFGYPDHQLHHQVNCQVQENRNIILSSFELTPATILRRVEQKQPKDCEARQAALSDDYVHTYVL